jgi:DNA recombination protein RmuC
VGPTTLLYVIRIVTVLLDSAKQARNVKDVMDRGTLLYEKFVGFINDLEAVGKSLRGATNSYESARKKLSEGQGNLVFQVEELRKLGVKRKPQSGTKKKVQPTIPLKWLTDAGVGDSGLELAAEAETDEDPHEDEEGQ